MQNSRQSRELGQNIGSEISAPKSAFVCWHCGAAERHRKLRDVRFGKSDGTVEFRRVCDPCLRESRAINAQRIQQKYGITKSEYLALAGLCRLSRKGAADRRIPWNMSVEDFARVWTAQRGICALTGRKMSLVDAEAYSPTNASMDRIDSRSSYRLGNVQFVCSIVNIMKGAADEQTFVEWCAAVVRHALTEKAA